MHDLRALIARLRDPERGCPWDLEQTPESYVGCVLEEGRELVEAVRAGAPDRIADELGDLLFNVLFLAHLYENRGDFTLAEVCRRTHEKLVRRHPHVFGDAVAKNAADAIRLWDEAKRREREG